MSDASKTCKFCNKVFANQPNKSRHQNHYCKSNPKLVSPAASDKTTHVPSLNLESKIQELIDLIKNNSDTHQTNIHYGDNVQTNVVFVNNYGKETMSHITPEFLDQCIAQKRKGLVTLLDKIHFAPEVPENRNIKIISRKRDVMGTYQDGEWKRENKNSILHDLIDKGYKILYRHYIDTVDKDEDDKREASYFDFLMSIINPKSNTYYQLRKDLFVMIENATLYVIGK